MLSVDQVAWLVHFITRGVAQMDAERARITAKINGEEMWYPGPGFFGRAIKVDHEKDSAATVVIEAAHDVDDLDGLPSSARRLYSTAAAAGWRVRCVGSLAADPRKGIIEAVTVRFARHDERGFAAWWNGRFDCAQYLRHGQGIERLGWRTTVKVRSVLDAIEGIARPLDMSLGQ